MDQRNRETLESRARDLISYARERAIYEIDNLDRAFFGAIALRLSVRPDWQWDNCATNGVELCYNPEFVAGLTKDEIYGVIGHEAGHVAYKHHLRREARDPGLWTLAANLALNQRLLAAGFILPKGAEIVGRGDYADLPRHKDAETYYRLLATGAGLPQQIVKCICAASGTTTGGAGSERPPSPEPGPGAKPDDASAEPHDASAEPDDASKSTVADSGDSELRGAGRERKPGLPIDPCGSFWEPEGNERHRAEAAVDSIVGAAAQVVISRGYKHGVAEAIVRVYHRHSQLDYRDVLSEFVSARLLGREDFSWRPQRHYLARGIVIPSLVSDAIGELVVHIDASGSMRAWLPRIAVELEAILGARPVKVHVVYCDAKVYHTEEWTPCDGPLVFGRATYGGTDHRPVWRWIEKNAPNAVGCVSLTDGATSWGNGPVVPLLCILTPGGYTPPFGTYVRLPEQDG